MSRSQGGKNKQRNLAPAKDKKSGERPENQTRKRETRSKVSGRKSTDRRRQGQMSRSQGGKNKQRYLTPTKDKKSSERPEKQTCKRETLS